MRNKLRAELARIGLLEAVQKRELKILDIVDGKVTPNEWADIADLLIDIWTMVKMEEDKDE